MPTHSRTLSHSYSIPAYNSHSTIGGDCLLTSWRRVKGPRSLVRSFTPRQVFAQNSDLGSGRFVLLLSETETSLSSGKVASRGFLNAGFICKRNDSMHVYCDLHAGLSLPLDYMKRTLLSQFITKLRTYGTTLLRRKGVKGLLLFVVLSHK